MCRVSQKHVRHLLGCCGTTINQILLLLLFLIEGMQSLGKSEMYLLIYGARKSKLVAASKPEDSLFSVMLKSRKLIENEVLSLIL